MAQKPAQIALFGTAISLSQKATKTGPFLPLSGAQRGAVEVQTSSIECGREVLMGTTLGDTKGPTKKS